MHLIRHSFPSQVIGTFQVLGLLENIDLCDKFLRGQFVIVNAQGCQEEAGFLFFLGAVIVHGGFHLLLNFGKETLNSQTARMKEIRKLPDYLATYHEMKPVYDGLQKIKFTRAKEKYKADHAAELKQFYEARRKLSAEFPDGKIDQHKLDAEYAKLEQEHEETYAQFKSIRADS